MNTAKIQAALDWARLLQQPAPVSVHHQRAVAELWSMLEGLGIKTTLEVGCGNPPGLLVPMLQERGIEAVGLDQFSGCDCQADAHDLPFPDNSFDLVAARHCLEHVLIPPLVLMEMARVSKRYLLVVVPWTSDKAVDWPDHIYVLPQRGWKRMFDKLGLRVLRYEEGDHTEHDVPWADHEFRYLLEKKCEQP